MMRCSPRFDPSSRPSGDTPRPGVEKRNRSEAAPNLENYSGSWLILSACCQHPDRPGAFIGRFPEFSAALALLTEATPW